MGVLTERGKRQTRPTPSASNPIKKEHPIMADYLPVLSGGLLPSKIDRQFSNATRRDLARLERVTQTTQHGMVAVSHLASIEAALMDATPHAAGRIHAVACAGAIQVVGIVHDAGRSL
jgi:hypothetical protein